MLSCRLLCQYSCHRNCNLLGLQRACYTIISVGRRVQAFKAESFRGAAGHQHTSPKRMLLIAQRCTAICACCSGTRMPAQQQSGHKSTPGREDIMMLLHMHPIIGS